MKKSIFILALLFSVSISAQETKKWMIGIGVNFIDNTNSQDDNYLDVSNWNATMSVSKLTAQYAITKNFAVSSEFTLNTIDSNKDQNGGKITTDLAYFGCDLNARYNTASLLKLSSKYSLEPIMGLGFLWADNNPNQSANVGFSLGYFFNDSYGVRFQTLGKFASDENNVGNNMIQHALELVFKL